MSFPGSTDPASVTTGMLSKVAGCTRRRSILKTSTSRTYSSPHCLIYELNNTACLLVSERRSLSLAYESFRATLKIILALIRTETSEVQLSREVREACQHAVSLVDEMRHLINEGQTQQQSSSMPVTHSNSFAIQGSATSVNHAVNDIETPISINLLDLNSYSQEQQSIIVLCNMALAARLCPTIKNSIALQLFQFAYQSSSGIGDWHKKLQMQRRVLQSMIDICSSEGYDNEVAPLLHQLIAAEIQNLIEFPTAAGAA